MNEKLLIGTYSKTGIYELEFNETTLIEFNKNADFENCSFLYKHSNIIYSVVEFSSNSSYSNGYLTARTDNLSVLSSSSISGKSPCHITLDKQRNLLYISNYEDGSLDVFSLNNDGSINKLICHKIYTPISHIHSTALSADATTLFVIDLGDNKLFAYEINYNGSDFYLKDLDCFKFSKKCGPRHFVINENNIYVITENSCELYHLLFTENNKFEFINKAYILPTDISKSKNDTGCAIKLSNDNTFIYVTIRGNNSISVFNTSLELLQNISCYGSTPRDINFNSTQDFMFCANQNSSDISIFKRNKKTGYLLFESKYPINSPACIIL